MRIAALLVVVAACHTPPPPVAPALVVAATGGAGSSWMQIVDDPRAGLGVFDVKLALALRTQYGAQHDTPAAPMGLAPTDGSELVLQALDARVELDGALARTQLTFTFHNPEPRRREGRFSVTLPDGATVAKFAMKIAGVWRESRVVTRERGREVFETILKERRDPALLERDLANQFSARVFPIEANENKELVLVYEHAVSAARPYVLPLRGLPAIPRLHAGIVTDGATTLINTHRQAPDDIVVPIGAGDLALAADEVFVARVEAPAGGAPAALGRVLVLVDTSASRATVMARQAAAVRAITGALPPDATVVIAAYDTAVTELYRGEAARAGDVAARLYEHGALGASDLGGALRAAAAIGMDRVILVGDGMPTAGEREPATLATLARVLPRVDVVQVGATIDREALVPIVSAGRAPGALLDGRDLARVTRQLALAVPGERPIRVAGAGATWPATTRGVAPGDPIWVFGRRAASSRLAIHIGDRVVTVAAARAEDPARVERAVAGAEIAALTEAAARAEGHARAQIAKQIELLAMEHQLVSMQTSLIVLESDADERRFLDEPPAQEAVATESVQPKGEVIVISDSAPTIDPTSTSLGITIDRNYIQNIPVPGRSFEGVNGEHAVNLSGSTSIENRYVVDGLTIRSRGRGAFRVKHDTMSPLAHDLIARSIWNGGMFVERDEEEAALPARSEPAAAHDPWTAYAAPHAGDYLAITQALAARDRDRALSIATAAQLANPGEVAAILGLGEALEARGAHALAIRAYASLMDLYPNRAELLRTAGERLDRVAQRVPAARALAIDAYRRAIAERPDHVHGYRLLALALLLENRPDADAEVLGVLRAGLARSANAGVSAVLLEDRAIAEAVLAARHPELRATLFPGHVPALSAKPSLRFVLAWETDANDVDLHVRDGSGEEAFFSKRGMPSGGMLVQDITNGYGPEMFSILEPAAFPYRIAVHYYNRGPMGVGLGTVQIIRHDGKGNLEVAHAPFLIQNDQAMIELPGVDG